MRGDATVIRHLNSVLKNELTAINQYFLHARMLRHWGVTKLGAFEYGETLQEILSCDLQLELAAMPVLREAIAYCEGVRDFVSRELFRMILDSEEEHVDFLETQLGLDRK